MKKYEYKDYAGFDCGGVEIGIKTWGELEKPRKGEPVINFLVTDIKGAFHKLKENGVQIVKEPYKTQWGAKILLFCDTCLLYTSPSPRDAHESRMPSSA